MLIGPAIVSLFAVLAFGLVLWRIRILPRINGLTGVAVSGVSAMFDTSLDDEQQEKAVQRAGLSLILGAWQIVWRFALALGATGVPILIADRLGWVEGKSALGMLLRLDFILAVSLASIILFWALGRKRSENPSAITNADAYTSGDRLFHVLAFSGPATHRTLARLDGRAFSRSLAGVADHPPVFVTSLARAGTTALLNAMEGLPQIATHRYRDMPFISAPLLWSRLVGTRRKVVERERAHGDGITIGLDSAEAFDEIFWRLHWPEKYADNGMALWTAADDNPQARDFFVEHFRKIALLRHPDLAHRPEAGIRYLSKNNANIARLNLLPNMFPGASVIVPLRAPAAHAASLLRQHRNFTDMHAKDAFVARYMRDIGHLEFGALHTPIRFEGFDPAARSPDTADYWLAYWIAAFREIRNHLPKVLVVTQDDLRAAPGATMSALLERIDVQGGTERGTGRGTTDFPSFFRPGPDPRPADLFSPHLLSEAEELYAEIALSAVR